MADSSVLWQRNIEAIVGKRGETGLVFKDLKIKFNIVSNRKKKPNQAKIEIFNLNRDSRSFLDEEDAIVVILNVGYGDILQKLWEGDITRTNSTKRGPDWITTIESGDGLEDLTKATFKRAYKAGAPFKQVIKDIAVNFKNSVKGAVVDIAGEVNKNGLTFEGIASVAMDRILKDQNMGFSIQNNEIQILKNEAVTNEEAVIVSPQTGLINSPIKLQKGAIKFKCLIQPGLKPGRAIELRSALFDRTIINPTRIDFRGDSRGNEWYAMVTGVDISDRFASGTRVNESFDISSSGGIA